MTDPTDDTLPARGRDRAIAIWLGLASVCVLLLFSGGAFDSRGWDGPSMYAVTRSLVEEGSVAVDPRYGIPGADGDYYARFGLGMPLAGTIPYLIARPLANATPDPEGFLETSVGLLVPIASALLVVGLYRLARRLGGGVGGSLLVAVGAVAGTYMLPYTKDFYSEPLATLFLVLAIDRALASQPLWAGAAAAAAAVTRPLTFAFAPLLLWRLVAEGGWRAAVRAAVPLVLGLALSLTYNVARFADPLDFGYSDAGFTPSILPAVGGLLFHPNKSVLLFAPIVVLLPFAIARLWRAHRTAFWLLTGNAAMVFGITAAWIGWDGGWVWGPRLLLPGLIPAVAAVAGWARESGRPQRIAVAALFLAGFIVSAPTLLVSTRAQLLDNPPDRGPSIVRQYEAVAPTVTYSADHAFEREAESVRRLELWQADVLRAAGRAGIVPSAVLSALLIGGAIGATMGLRRNIAPRPAAADV
jgi:hypothetical protein